MSEDNLEMFSRMYFPKDENGASASVLVGVVDKLQGGHYVPIAFDPITGQLMTTGTSEIKVRTPSYTLMHNAITAPEGVTPLAPKGYAAEGRTQLIIDIVVDGAGAYVTLVPLVWNPLLGKYIPGEESPRITETTKFVLDIQSPEDIYLLPIEVVGTISVAVAGV